MPLVTTPASAEDRALVARMSAGDEAALGTLYDRWNSVVRALALRIVGDRDEAEDVVEETFWQLWRQAARYEESRGGVSTWLLTMARSRALDRRRALTRRREERMEPSDGDGDASSIMERGASTASSEVVDPARAAELTDLRERITGALRTLPEEQREALQLAYFEGLSQSEIAERTGQPLGTIKTRTRLAMQKLRDLLAGLREAGVSGGVRR
jgi:RNA polymerase sigma-70 factor (ECF subfamily)